MAVAGYNIELQTIRRHARAVARDYGVKQSQKSASCLTASPPRRTLCRAYRPELI